MGRAEPGAAGSVAAVGQAPQGFDLELERGEHCPRQPSARQCLLLALQKQIELENENLILDESNKVLMT